MTNSLEARFLDDLDSLFPDDLVGGDPTERFFEILFNGDRELAKREILALLNELGDPNDRMIEIMAKIASGGEG